MVLVIAKLNAPCSGAGSPVFRPHKAKAADHQLKEHEHVEQIARQHKAGHCPEKYKHQGVVELVARLNEPPGKQKSQQRQKTCQDCKACADRVNNKTNPQHDMAAWIPVSKPVDKRVVP